MEQMPLADFLKAYIPRPPRVIVMQAVADKDMMWMCACGHREWNHYQWCADCGKERPPPPPDPEPSDLIRDEAP